MSEQPAPVRGAKSRSGICTIQIESKWEASIRQTNFFWEHISHKCSVPNRMFHSFREEYFLLLLRSKKKKMLYEDYPSVFRFNS